jgi:branched-chain amino acid transport system ATP-binding protein
LRSMLAPIQPFELFLSDIKCRYPAGWRRKRSATKRVLPKYTILLFRMQLRPSSLSRAHWSNLRALVPEGRQIFPTLTVRENLVATAANYGGMEHPWTLHRVFELFPQLVERRNNMGNQLSGGEQQMLAIGRALMLCPKLLILDEATEGLAPIIREKIWQCLDSLKRLGLSILLVDKNLDELAPLADRTYIMEKGRIVWTGDTNVLTGAADLRLRYLGL